MAKGLAPASEIDAYCTHCRLDLAHRIIDMREGRIGKVECLTCRGHHLYRRPRSAAPEPAPRAQSARTPAAAAPRARRSKADEARESWEKAIAGRSAQEFQSYAVAARFAAGQLLRHKKFGDGVVTGLVEGDKIQVLFADGQKLLAHGRS
jgi:hypothetical protein